MVRLEGMVFCCAVSKRRRWKARLRPTLRRRTRLTARLEPLQLFFEVRFRLKLSEKLIALPSGLVIHAENRKRADLIGSDCSLGGAIRQKNRRSDCERRPPGSVESV